MSISQIFIVVSGLVGIIYGTLLIVSVLKKPEGPEEQKVFLLYAKVLMLT